MIKAAKRHWHCNHIMAFPNTHHSISCKQSNEFEEHIVKRRTIRLIFQSSGSSDIICLSADLNIWSAKLKTYRMMVMGQHPRHYWDNDPYCYERIEAVFLKNETMDHKVWLMIKIRDSFMQQWWDKGATEMSEMLKKSSIGSCNVEE